MKSKNSVSLKSPDLFVNTSDKLFIQATVALAELGRFTCAPNPTVGCIITRNGQVIGRGYHQYAGQGHAEVNAIADAAGMCKVPRFMSALSHAPSLVKPLPAHKR